MKIMHGVELYIVLDSNDETKTLISILEKVECKSLSTEEDEFRCMLIRLLDRSLTFPPLS